MAIGIARTGGMPGPGQSIVIGSEKAWSTSISWQEVMSKSAATSDSIKCHDQAASPLNSPSAGMPQPSSSFR